jgi:hypoxanthine phosphoribosyltransferase
MVDTKSKTYLTWGDIEYLVDTLCTQITQSKFQIEDIYGMPRGGLIPAVMISHKLDLPLTTRIISPFTLIMDDICDSGETFKELYKQYPNNYFACLHFKPETSDFLPHLWADSLYSDDWIVYPWENENADAIQDYLK